MAIRFTQHARKRLNERLPLPTKEVKQMIRRAISTKIAKSFLYKDDVDYLKYDNIVFVTKKAAGLGGKVIVITVFKD